MIPGKALIAHEMNTLAEKSTGSHENKSNQRLQFAAVHTTSRCAAEAFKPVPEFF